MNDEQKKVVFTKKIVMQGASKQPMIYIPAVVAKLLDYEKEYKITLELLDTEVVQ